MYIQTCSNIQVFLTVEKNAVDGVGAAGGPAVVLEQVQVEVPEPTWRRSTTASHWSLSGQTCVSHWSQSGLLGSDQSLSGQTCCTDGNIVFRCDSDKNSLVIIHMF